MVIRRAYKTILRLSSVDSYLSSNLIPYFKLHYVNNVIYSFMSSILHCMLETA
jgi:hypothetical protein